MSHTYFICIFFELGGVEERVSLSLIDLGR